MKNIILLILFIVVSTIVCNKNNKDNKEMISTNPPVTEKKPETSTDNQAIKPESLIYKYGYPGL